VPRNADLEQTKFLFVTVQTVGLGIDGDTIVRSEFCDQLFATSSVNCWPVAIMRAEMTNDEGMTKSE